MPVIVVGADTPAGMEIARAFANPNREVRAFVSDPDAGAELRRLDIKVALGDVSDESHVGAAAIGCFSAVLVSEAAHDSRERSFAASAAQVLAGWGRAVAEAAVRRVIWVASEATPETAVRESVVVDPGTPGLASIVIGLDDAKTL